MIFQKNKTIELFDKFLLTIPTKLKHHQDELSDTEALFITDRFDSFVISFEEGMADMTKPEKMKMEKPLLNTGKTENISVYAEVFRTTREVMRSSPLSSGITVRRYSLTDK